MSGAAFIADRHLEDVPLPKPEARLSLRALTLDAPSTWRELFDKAFVEQMPGHGGRGRGRKGKEGVA